DIEGDFRLHDIAASLLKETDLNSIPAHFGERAPEPHSIWPKLLLFPKLRSRLHVGHENHPIGAVVNDLDRTREAALAGAGQDQNQPEPRRRKRKPRGADGVANGLQIKDAVFDFARSDTLAHERRTHARRESS